MGGFEETGCSDFNLGNNPDFHGPECSDLGVDGWVVHNPNIVHVRICKSVRIIGRSLTELLN